MPAPIGGAYRWDESKKEWIPLMDWVDASERGLLVLRQ
jgi:hypothetical protein